MANTDRNTSITAVGGGNGGCCLMSMICWSTDDPNYNPCGNESDLRITANFVESTPQRGDAGISITATPIIVPVQTVFDNLSYYVRDVLGTDISQTGSSYFGYADLLGGTDIINTGTYTIKSKKINATTYEITIKGATQEQLGFDALETGKFTVLFKDITSLQWMPKRLVLFNDAIYDITDITGGFKFSFGITATSGANGYWMSETAYKFTTRGFNKFFDGKKMLNKAWTNVIANEPQQLSFIRTITFKPVTNCEQMNIQRDVIVDNALYPFDTNDVPVTYPIDITTTLNRTIGNFILANNGNDGSEES